MDRWITAHRIGIAAYLGSGLGGVIEDQQKLLTLRPKLGGLLKRYLVDEVGGEARTRYRILLGLPPSVLHLLSQSLRDYPNLARRELERLRKEVFSANRQLTSPWDESERTPLSYAQSWSHHLLFGSGSPYRLLELGRILTGSDAWRRVADTHTEVSFTTEAQTLRDPQSCTRERCDAIDQMQRVLGMLPYWAQLENALYQQQFFWPLLILRQEQRRGVAASVPVAIDVIFDNKNEARFTKEHSVLSNEWRRSLHRCMEIAKDLWQAEHWHRAVSMGNLIEGASVEIDFSIADRITSDATSLINRGIKVIDRSAEAYFVQAIISRLLGASATVASAITGSVGPKWPDRKADYPFVKPGGLRSKLAFAFASRSFERVVLPSDAIATFNDFKRATRQRQTADTLFPKNLGTVTDIVQVLGWRRNWYVRCPDVQWHSQVGASALPTPSHPGVKQVCQAIAGNQGPILRLPGASPLAVLSAIRYIDRKLMGKYAKNRLPISWGVLRAVPWELDARFWHTLWEAIGASRSSFESFIKQPRSEDALQQVARLFNHFRPTPDSPSHMAPDVLVIIDAQHLAEAQAQVTNPLSRPFLVMQLLEELEQKNLLERYSPIHRQRLGSTRIVLLSREDMETGDSSIITDDRSDFDGKLRHLVEEVRKKPRVYQLLRGVDQLEDHLTRVLRALAIYQYGFTQQAASLVIHRMWNGGPKPTGFEIRHEILNSLVSQDLLRRSHGMYHVPDEVRDKVNIDASSALERVKLHFTAGSAVAPYVAAAEYPSLAADTAFRPQFVHEARNHFDTALSLIKELKTESEASPSEELPMWEKTVQRAMGSLIKFAEPPTWGQVDKLLHGVRDAEGAFAMAQELLAWDECCNVTIHPEHYLWNARAAAQLAKRRPKLRSRASELFELALESCKRFPSEAAANIAHVLSYYAAFLFMQVPARESLAVEHSKQVLRLLQTGAPVFVIDGNWFDQYGDHLDHADAAQLYELGRQTHPKMGQLWLKALGAASLSSNADIVDIVLGALAVNSRVLRTFASASKAKPKVAERLEEAERVLATVSGIAADAFSSPGPYYIRMSEELLKHGGEDAEPKALAILQRGVRKCPSYGALHLALGQFYEQRECWKEAEAAYCAGPKFASNHNQVHLKLGRFYEHRERWDDAEAAYRGGVDCIPDDGPVHVALAQFYEQQGKLDKAEDVCRVGIECAPRASQIYFALGGLYEQRERWDEAEAVYREAIERLPNDGPVHIVLGQFYEQQGKLEKAEEVYRAGIERAPEANQIYLALGQFYAQHERWDEAEALYCMAVEHAFAHGDFYMALGRLYEQRARWDEAEAAYRAAVERTADDGIPPMALGRFYERRERWDEAEAAYRASIDCDIGHEAAYLALGLLYEQQGQLDKAEAAYRATIERNADNGRLHVALGRLYEHQEQFEKAEAAYLASIKHDVGHGAAYVALGRLYERRERWPEAEAAYRASIEHDAGHEAAYLALGMLYEQEGQLDDAGATYRACIEQNADNGRLHVALGWVYEQQGQLEKAEATYLASIVHDVGHGAAYVALGRIYERRERWSEAEAAYRASIEHDVGYEAAYVALGMLYEQQGHLDKAEAAYRANIGQNANNG